MFYALSVINSIFLRNIARKLITVGIDCYHSVIGHVYTAECTILCFSLFLPRPDGIVGCLETGCHTHYRPMSQVIKGYGVDYWSFCTHFPSVIFKEVGIPSQATPLPASQIMLQAPFSVMFTSIINSWLSLLLCRISYILEP